MRMKVVHISTSDTGHGAAIAAYRLFSVQREAGMDVTLLVAEKLSDDPDVHLVFPAERSGLGGRLLRLVRYLERGVNACGPQGVFSAASVRLLFDRRLRQADLIHLHNLHWHDRCLSLLLLPLLSRFRPVVWTLHDMWAITGHCIASRDCQRWKKLCGRCPYLGTYVGLAWESSYLQCLMKKLIYRFSDFTVVTPSDWLSRQVAVSPLMSGKRVVTVHNSSDQVVFVPRDRKKAREAIGVTDDAMPVIMFVSAFIDDPIKGYDFFEQAMVRLKDAGLASAVLLVVGRGSASDRLHRIFRVVEPGYTVDRGAMAALFSAADVYVMPSISDNFPGVVLESLSCGTPVVAFDTGGIPEMIEHRVTGYLAPQRDVAALAAGIGELLAAPDPRKVREACVQSVSARFSDRQQGDGYARVYREAMGA
jgi:glycosyltransferase involved in cell wall biosynthesis